MNAHQDARAAYLAALARYNEASDEFDMQRLYYEAACGRLSLLNDLIAEYDNTPKDQAIADIRDRAAQLGAHAARTDYEDVLYLFNEESLFEGHVCRPDDDGDDVDDIIWAWACLYARRDRDLAIRSAARRLESAIAAEAEARAALSACIVAEEAAAAAAAAAAQPAR